MSDVPAPLLATLARCRHLLVLSGAGISAASGVPTFRGNGGYWEGHRVEDLATPEGFRRNPRLVWEWYAARREQLQRLGPNAGHRALAGLQDLLPRVTVVTQNIDHLHQRAGSREVIELHGNLAQVRCSEDGLGVDRWDDQDEVPPRCPRCFGLLRPAVVWFGELLPPAALAAAQAAAATCDGCLVVGTSAQVYPAAGLPLTVLHRGRPVIEVNPEPTPLTALATVSLRERAEEALPRLIGRLATQDSAPWT
ncbi:MAG: NAD-dependent deacylase [Fimbriimonadaceae bacterium]|nr:NAD-dependent deacylase [Fimbriimonadaceae bacterium]